MAWAIFHTFLEKQHNGAAVDLNTDDLRVMLVTDVRAPVQATDTNMATIDDTEVSGDGYTAKGYDLATLSVALAAGVVTFDIEDVVWSQAAGGFTTARYAVLYKNTGTPANDTPIAYADLGGDKGNVDGDLTLEIDADGVFTVSLV